MKFDEGGSPVLPTHSEKRVVPGSIKRASILILLAGVVSGCAIYATDNWEDLFGPAQPRERLETADTEAGRIYLEQVQPILEQRCVVCHGCYDSPCQLNLASPAGIDRGASKDLVYDGARLVAAPPTRLFEDAHSTADWRKKGFYPVLNEHEQTPDTNLQASVIHHMLSLKRDNPLPGDALLADTFDLNLNRDQQCPKPGELKDFTAQFPLWGMPYALPGLNDTEYQTLRRWLQGGARMALPVDYDPATRAEVDRWETFLNGDSPKQQLMSRYLFEHWFIAHLYFIDTGDDGFFKLVRSSTPPGQPLQLLSTRRPYDDPGVERVYYRLWRDHSTTLDKTHMPYALGARRLAWLESLFLEPDYAVAELPSYDPEVAANPFRAFEAIPVESRWQFLLAEGQFTIMNFIKGPVCRGQVALNVIRDRFWVFFAQPGLIAPGHIGEFLSEQQANLRIPSAEGSTAAPLLTWLEYSEAHKLYFKSKSAMMNKAFPGGEHLTLDLAWDGEGHNQNAALTVFRHFDSASVVKGLVGPEPETAWLIDYSVLERIHYLLVAGFDVFGNVGHQLTARLYMDFLRMESEFNFLALLPPKTRVTQSAKWYQGASDEQRAFLYDHHTLFNQPSGISFTTDDPKLELFGLLEQRLAPVLNRSYDLDQASVPAAHGQALERLAMVKGLPLSAMPQLAFLNVQSDGGADHYYTILRNNAHSNISSLFIEAETRLPKDDTLTVVKGFIGSYPNAYWRVREEELPALVDQVAALTDESSYNVLMGRYGVRRTAPDFWQHSDKVISAHKAADPVSNALLDYNRLENR